MLNVLIAALFLSGGSVPILPTSYGTTLGDDIPIETRRLSKRVLVLTGVPSTCQVTVLATKKGVIVVDTGISHGFGAAFRSTIEGELGRADIAFVVNTHPHRDHTFGNQSFPDAMIIGHENCRRALKQLRNEWTTKAADSVKLHRERADGLSRQLGELDPDLDAGRIRLRIAVNNRIADDLTTGQRIVPPQVTFSERFSLDAGDMTLRLYFVGEGHTDGDIWIHIPEEGVLIVGDVFHPSSIANSMLSDRVDIARLLGILEDLLADGTAIKHAICGHDGILTAEELAIRRDYMQAIWTGLAEARAQGLDLASAKESLALERFDAASGMLGMEGLEIQRQHDEVLRKYWLQLSRPDSPIP